MSNKSRSTQQRRVKGHVDPSDAADDALLDVDPPSSNSGLMFLQQLRRHSAAVDQGTTHAPVSLPISDDESKQIRAEARAQAMKLYQEKGSAAVQSFLQQQIQTTKKKESDIAVAKKRGEAAAREKDQLTSELHQVTTAKLNCELQCKTMQADIKKQDEECARAAAELTHNREEVRTKILGDIKSLEDKMAAVEAEDEPMKIENETLREECAKLKKDFDESFKAYESNWAAKEQETSVLIKGLQATLQRTELLEAKVALARKEAQAVKEATEALKQHAKIYEERFTEYDRVASQSAEADRVNEEQRVKLQERLASAEEQKKEVHDIRFQLDKETTALRGTLASLKKKVVQLEKTKATVEAKCRAIQKGLEKK